MATRCGFIYEPINYLRTRTENSRVLPFLGIVIQKCIFGKIYVWLSNSNRIACVWILAQVS